MPMNDSERKLMQKLHGEYGSEKAKSIFEAMKTKAAKGEGSEGMFSKEHTEKRKMKMGMHTKDMDDMVS